MGSIKDKLKEKFLGEKVLSDDSPPPKPKKKRVKARKSTICKTCGQNIKKNKERDTLNYKNTYHQLLVEKHCKEHQDSYTTHKCKPHWCGDCSYLIKYGIEIQKGK